MAEEMTTEPLRFAQVEACADAVIERLSGQVRLALPLGLGKAALLANALYRRARERPEIELSIYTALTLELPKASSELQRRMLEPLLERLYADVPALDYAADLRRGALPRNVRVEEFFFRPGAFLGVPGAQQSYASLNYTHAARALMNRGANVIAQMVAPASGADAGAVYSLSCNPEVTLDLLDAAREGGAVVPLLVGQVNAALPFMPGDAALPVDRFDMLLEADDLAHPLFPVPNRAVSLAEHAIAVRVAALVKDGGTLQVGIGSLGDAVTYALGLRRSDNDAYCRLVTALGQTDGAAAELDTLPNGLYGASEMFSEGFLHLRRCGVLSRTVEDGIYLHGGFYLGSARFYQDLRDLPEAERQGIGMTRISFTNSLHGDEQRKRQQRRAARFVNSAMMMTLLGAAVSDGLEDGRVVSGVGGQYNFVAMAHELEGARSIMVLPATRMTKGKVRSNIVWRYGHVTIPRHLRDVVVTEYGVAELRGAADQDVIAALLNLADSRFQETLRRQAVAAGKLPQSYRIPERYRSNFPDTLRQSLADAGVLGALPFYPLGTDLTAVEAELAVALEFLAQLQGDTRALLAQGRAGWRAHTDPRLQDPLERLGLEAPRGITERLYRSLVSAALLDQVHASGRPLYGGRPLSAAS
ncbi:MAG: acetyl-CoA hydrolase/transferase C-terminal domain-containing protein [Pseudomonadales bacterium]